MQYTDTEFKTGANLNVIIGPNGSGKSSIVAGICLGLAGKPGVLGRAANLADYIKVGEEEAVVVVELWAEDGNMIVERRWGRDNKSTWRVGGRRCSQKEVEELVARLRIQVDNLCQFLPQDKVHDFSRQSSCQMLNSTVDAVGDLQLKEKHRQLKELQRNLTEGEDLFERKRQLLQEKREKCQRMEAEVAVFEEKKRAEEKIRLLEGRLAWAKVKEMQREGRAKKEAKEGLEKQLEKEERQIEPLKRALTNSKVKKQSLEQKLVADNLKVKESRAKAQNCSRRIERLEEELVVVEEEKEEVKRREEEKRANISRIKITIAELEAEYQSMEEEVGGGKEEVESARKRVRQKQRQVEEKQAEKEEEQQSLRRLRAAKDELGRELKDLQSVEQQKMAVLRRVNEDAFKALLWLQDHKETFKGEVFPPFIVSGNVLDPSNAIFVENSIPSRDLQTFFFSDVEDMNLFLRITRQEKGWKKVSAVLTPSLASDTFQPGVDQSSLKALGFVAHVREMVVAPDPVLAFLCSNHAIHKVAVFCAKAERFHDRLVEEFNLAKFFLGTKQQTVSKSQYSAAKSTLTRAVNGKGLLTMSVDKERVRRLEDELKEKEKEEEEVRSRQETTETELAELNKGLEEARKENKALEQKRNFRTKAGARIEVEKRNLRGLLAEADTSGEKEGLKRRVREAVLGMSKAVVSLQEGIREVDQGQRAMELTRLASFPMEDLVEQQRRELEAASESLSELRMKVRDAGRELEESKRLLGAALREARAATGGAGNEPPIDVANKWREENLPGQKEAIEVPKIFETQKCNKMIFCTQPTILGCSEPAVLLYPVFTRPQIIYHYIYITCLQISANIAHLCDPR